MIGEGKGSGPGQMQTPWGVAVDENHVFVCDEYRIQIFAKEDGRLVRELRQGAEGHVKAVNPYLIALHGERVYVTDDNNGRVAVFRS
jgi:hypothetical protein